jgi:hypothetical protein
LEIAVPAVTATLFYSIALSAYVVDDAYISFAYAKVFATESKLLLRPDNWVEANSSFLWSLLLGVSTKVAGNPVCWSKIYGALFHFITTVLTARLFVRPHMTSRVVAMHSVVIATAVGLGLWANYGMENGLVAALCAAAVTFLPRLDLRSERLWAPLIMAGIYMSRPEGFGLVAVLYGVEVARRVRLRVPLRGLLYGIGLLLVVVIAYESLGWLYYGSLLPNSATAKVGASLGARIALGLRYVFLSPHLLVGGVVPLALLFGLWRFARHKLRFTEARDASVILGLGITAGQLGFVVLAGGDWMPAARFLSIVVPFATGYVASCVIEWRWAQRLLPQAALLALFTLVQIVAVLKWMPTVQLLRDGDANAMAPMVSDLNRVATSDDTLALSDIGRASYGFRGDIFDWWGLGSKMVADRNESVGRIKVSTVKEANPEFLVLYANAADGLVKRGPDSGIASYTLRFIEEEELLHQYCRLAAYRFSENRYHILLGRRDVVQRTGFAEAAPPTWSASACAPAGFYTL